MPYRIAVDTGGTFSDVVVVDEEGQLSLSKAPTTPERIFSGISEALAQGAAERGLTLPELLGESELFTYGTTAATNAIITGRTARTAFLTTEGFADTLVLREGGKLHPFDFRAAYPPPYVPRRLTFEVRERVTSEGTVLVPLDVEATRETLRGLRDRGIEAIAVSLLWSIVDPRHEEAVAELIEEELPGVAYTLSHRLNPIIREYRRASSAAIDASLKPLMQRHLRRDGCRPARRRLLGRAARRDVLRRCPERRGRLEPPDLLRQLRAGGGARRRQGIRGRRPERDRLRHGRDELRRQRHPRRLHQVHPRDVAGGEVRRAHHGALVGRRQEHRGGRGLDRLDRLRRPPARRARQRGRGTRARLLRPRRDRADGDRRGTRARLHRPRLLPGRPHQARPRRAPARRSGAGSPTRSASTS